jgi:glycosyltransferase involved in cell wall biosynthesis
MIIGIDAKRLFNNFTGLGNYSRTLLHNLLQYSSCNSYYLYTPEIRYTPEIEEFTSNPACSIFVPETLLKSYWRSVSILKQLQKDNIQLYHGLSHEIPLNIQKSKIRSVVTMHDIIFKIYPGTYHFLDRNIYDIKFRYSCINADRIIAISENTKNDIVRFYGIDPGKIEVIYQSCNPLFYRLKEDIGTDEILKKYNIPVDYLLYVGSVTERKNIITIINAIDHLPGDLKIPLVIVGKGRRYKFELEKLIEKKGIGHYVIWIDNLTSNEHLRVLYERSQIFIYPSVYEGFGIPVIEALLSRTPVITSNVSSLPEAGGPGSYYIDPTDSEQMAAGIIRILSDTKFKEKMISTGYSYAIEKFDAERNTRKLMDLYSKIIAEM